ncbi:pumilio-family RNA binding repeat containing protein, partial [Aphelenchoides avenae]
TSSFNFTPQDSPLGNFTVPQSPIFSGSPPAYAPQACFAYSGLISGPVSLSSFSVPLPSLPRELPSAFDPAGILTSVLDAPLANFVFYADSSEGSAFLVENFSLTPDLRNALFEKILHNGLFTSLALRPNSNKVVFKLVADAGVYMEAITDVMCRDVVQLSCGSYSFHIVKKALDKFTLGNVFRLVDACRGFEVALANDEIGTRVVQRLIRRRIPATFERFVQPYNEPANLATLVQNQRGYRIVQILIERLEGSACASDDSVSHRILDKLLAAVVDQSFWMVSDSLGNFIIQSIVKSSHLRRTTFEIFKRSVFCRVLPLSQEKHASHVIEVLFRHASRSILQALCTEILDGYEPDMDGRGAVDILLFDQYGNYVVKTMLSACFDVVKLRRSGNEQWFYRVKERIEALQGRLLNYSHGIRIVDMLNKCSV